MRNRLPGNDLQQIVIEALDGELSTSFSLMYDRFAPSIMGLIARMVGEGNQAEDIFQNCFREIWEQRATYDPSQGTLFMWMIKIARRVAIAAIRSGVMNERSEIHELNKIVYSIEMEDYLRRGNLPCAGDDGFVMENDEKQAVSLICFSAYTLPDAAMKLNIPADLLKLKLKTLYKKLKGTQTAW